jgi:rubrerythrin
MKSSSTDHTNRTAASIHPKAAADQAAFAQSTPPSSEGTGNESAQVRQLYESDGLVMGSLPAIEGKKRTTGRTALFIDKVGERLAFERSGTRLYEALISKHDAPMPVGAGSDSIERKRLEEICAEEYRHFMILTEAMVELGGDPTAITPSANVAAVISEGLPKVVQDPRTSFNQCLDAILVAELADNEGWAVLVSLAEELGHDALVSQFQEVWDQEQEHLATIRELVLARAAP